MVLFHKMMLKMAYEHKSPVVIRYPRGNVPSDFHTTISDIEWGKSVTTRNGGEVSIWATGPEYATALKVSDKLRHSGIKSEVVNTRFLRPFDTKKLLSVAKHKHIVTIEDNLIYGGLGSTVDEILVNIRHRKVLHFGWKDEIIPHGTINGIKEKAGFTPDKIVAVVLPMAV